MSNANQRGSRIPDFYKMSIRERLSVLHDRGLLTDDDYNLMLEENQTLGAVQADRLIENVIGCFTLPMGLGLNFQVNGKDYVVPMVVEEPSIVAGVSGIAKLVRESGGFSCTADEPMLIGQIQIVDVPHPARAAQAIREHKTDVLNLANSLQPKMVARGGGAKDLEVFVHRSEGERGDMVVVHLVVDTRDAMGANLVNSMCEGVAPLVEKISAGKVFLRILSNLTDRSMVRAECRIPAKLLATRDYVGEEARDGIILAAEFAAIDPYRATTHNKGVMNGIDAVAIATGNDWRAIEAAAHAWAARGPRYTSLTKWFKGEHGELVGQIELPLKVGTVGGQVESNPAVGIAHRILGITSARELAEVMAAVGLAQNLAALRALSTEGIQRGHMTLHARSVAVAAGATPASFDEVVERLIESGDIKVWKAKEIIQQLEQRTSNSPTHPEENLPGEGYSSGYGKVILLGEHAAVYGSHVVAAALPMAIQARAHDYERKATLIIPRWGVELPLHEPGAGDNSLQTSMGLILSKLGLRDHKMMIEVYPHIPRAMGLGGSAALAVAVIRAVANHAKLNLSDEDINGLAYECEKIAHGTPSGIDNTMATYGSFVLYKRGEQRPDGSAGRAEMRKLNVPKPLPMVVGMSGVESLTHATVERVRQAWLKNKERYDRIFQDIDALALQAVKAVEAYELDELGELMNLNQGYLNALQVSHWELEELNDIAKKTGALGAKLTGGGGGGSMIALCRNEADCEKVATAMRRAGYRALVAQLGA